MLELQTKNGVVKVYAETIESAALEQIRLMSDSPVGVGANVRIMPDCHVGAGCCVGTTMMIVDKVCPNLVGVDIGCGVALAKLNVDFKGMLERLDGVIRNSIPFGMKNNSKQTIEEEVLLKMVCWKELPATARHSALFALGSLGGGNHFIEAYEDGYVAVHSGSRNIGLQVAQYYQKIASVRAEERKARELADLLNQVAPELREKVLVEWKAHRSSPSGLEYLEGQDLRNYLHDQSIMAEFAAANRAAIIKKIAVGLRAKIGSYVECAHNYIGKDVVLRKGAISAKEGELCLIPLNMRDGLLVCRGKGNSDWNFSAPHGAGRLYGRRAAKDKFTVSAYKQSMEGIFSTCISADTLDEAPFVYKNMEEIIRAIEPTVLIEQRLIPLYNFKASE